MASNELTHNGYTGSIVVSIEDECLHGRILFIDDIVTYEGNNVQEASNAFKSAVDKYIAHCKKICKEPNKPYSGSLNVRIGPQRHRAMAQRAYRENTSINELLCQSVDLLLSDKTPVTEPYQPAANPAFTFIATGQKIATQMEQLAATFPDIGFGSPSVFAPLTTVEVN